MKLAISNIAWDEKYNYEIYRFLHDNGFKGIEIAPTKIFPVLPYERISEAEKFAGELKSKHNLIIPSIQSIWFGRQEKVFSTDEELNIMLQYTKSAIDFAAAMRCNNLVFGCPKNRIVNDYDDISKARYFFAELGQYAVSKGTVLSIEPNPTIYGTNFINTTMEAYEFVKSIDSKGIKVNVDLGTMIYNEEDVSMICSIIDWVNHIHISEPNLLPIERRIMHQRLAQLLRDTNYTGFVSIEMKTIEDIQHIKDTITYVKGVFS